MLNYQPEPVVNGKRAIRVSAKYLTETKQALYIDIDGDKKWIPKTFCQIDKTKGKIDIQEWFYKQLFPKG